MKKSLPVKFVSLFRFLLILLTLFSLNIIVVSQSDQDEIDAIIADMTLEQKVGQMFMVNLFGSELTYVGLDMLQIWQPGAVVIMENNLSTPQGIASLTNIYQHTIMDSGGIPLLVATDQEGGLIQRLREGFTNFPAPMLLTATADSDLIYRTAQAMAIELRSVGINMNLAPVADLNTNINNPIIGRRSAGNDIELVNQMLQSFIAGLQMNNVLATVKHFPGHGDTQTDSHLELPIITADRDRLFSVELPPFIASIEAGVGTVMVSHIWFTTIEPQENVPASLSYNVVTGLLREELGFDGIIMTDALDMDAIDTVYGSAEASIRAIQAGVDLIAIGANVGEARQAQAMQAVVDAVRDGEIDEAQIDRSVRRILLAKSQMGILDWSPIDVDNLDLNPPENDALIQEIFNLGTTVAYDENNLIPLAEDETVAIIYPANRSSIRRECEQYRTDIRWQGISNSPSQSEIDGAVSLANQVDTVIVFTRNAYYDDGQTALVNGLPAENTIVVALHSVYDWLRFRDIATYVLTYSPLDPAIPGACAILFGQIPANGQLSVDLTQFLDQ